MSSKLPATFSAKIIKSPARGGWMYVVWPKSAEFFGTRAGIKVSGTMDGQSFQTSFMPLGDGNHKLPVTAALAKRMGKGIGDTIAVVIGKRL